MRWDIVTMEIIDIMEWWFWIWISKNNILKIIGFFYYVTIIQY